MSKESIKDYVPPEVLEIQDPKDQEEEITIEAKYKEGDTPESFVINLIQDAHKQGIKLTFKEVMKQVEEALDTQEKEQEFSFSDMQAKSADLIIPKNITITIKAKPPKNDESEKKVGEKEEDDDFDDDDDDLDDDNDEKKDSQKEVDEDEDNFLITETMRVRDVLNTPEGTILNQSLEKIKEIGKRLVVKLNKLKDASREIKTPEPDNIKTDSLELFEFLEEAEENGQKLTDKLKADFDITLTRKLVPSEYILAYLYKIYKKKSLEMPDKILNSRRSGNSPATFTRAVEDERKK